MEKTLSKRKNYLVDRDFQSKFILKFCGLVVLAAVLFMALVYFLATKSTSVMVVNSRVVVKSTADFMLPVLIETGVLVIILISIATFIVTLFVSHKLAGPMYRFRKVMENLGSGDFSSEFTIRKGDQLQGLADSMNAIIKKNREELKVLKMAYPAFKKKLEDISEHEVSENKRVILRELKKTSEELDKAMRFFKA